MCTIYSTAVSLRKMSTTARHCEMTMKALLVRGCLIGSMVSRIRRKKNLPPRTAWQAEFSEPAKLCSCCLLALFQLLNSMSCCLRRFVLSSPKVRALPTVLMVTPRM